MTECIASDANTAQDWAYGNGRLVHDVHKEDIRTALFEVGAQGNRFGLLQMQLWLIDDHECSLICLCYVAEDVEDTGFTHAQLRE
jgi:hypothetical protein